MSKKKTSPKPSAPEPLCVTQTLLAHGIETVHSQWVDGQLRQYTTRNITDIWRFELRRNNRVLYSDHVTVAAGAPAPNRIAFLARARDAALSTLHEIPVSMLPEDLLDAVCRA